MLKKTVAVVSSFTSLRDRSLFMRWDGRKLSPVPSPPLGWGGGGGGVRIILDGQIPPDPFAIKTKRSLSRLIFPLITSGCANLSHQDNSFLGLLFNNGAGITQDELDTTLNLLFPFVRTGRPDRLIRKRNFPI